MQRVELHWHYISYCYRIVPRRVVSVTSSHLAFNVPKEHSIYETSLFTFNIFIFIAFVIYFCMYILFFKLKCGPLVHESIL